MRARSTRFNEFPKHSTSRFKLALQPQHGLRDFPRTRSGKPHHTNTAAPGRSGDGDDGVVEVHGAIVAGTLEDDQAAGSELRETQLRTGLLKERTRTCQSPTNYCKPTRNL